MISITEYAFPYWLCVGIVGSINVGIWGIMVKFSFFMKK
jgi:hypothetical protein